MTDPYPHPAHLQRLAQECAHLSHRTSQIAAELAAMQAVPPPAPVAPTPAPAWTPAPPAVPPPPPRRSWLSRAAEDGRLVGTVLAVTGVAVTVVGVGLLLVLAAQAGLLRPEVRVGAGALFATCLAALAVRCRARGAEVGAVALAATGIATAYLDVVAVTRLYHWVPTAVGLVLAAAVAGAGVAWARAWRSERLALITVAPLTGVAPLVAGGVDLGLVGFMLVVAVACVATSHRTPWAALPVAGVAGSSLWATAAIIAAHLSDLDGGSLLAMACASTAATGLVASGSAVTRRVSETAAALASAVGCAPALVCGLALGRGFAASVLAAVAVAAAALVVWAAPSAVRTTWACLAAVASVIAIPTAVDAPVAVPALLALAAVVTVVGRGDRVVAAVGTGLTAVGAIAYLGWSVPVASLVTPISRTDGQAASAIVASLLLVGAAAAHGGLHRQRPGASIAVGAVALYGLTATAVTVGVSLGGPGAGFLAGHMAATVLWVVAASVVLALTAQMPAGPARRAPTAGALTLAGAAVAKLVTFDLATLDGAFRVGAFVAAGLVLLAVGARQARVRAV